MINDGTAGSKEPHYISNPSDGDVYRIIAYVQTKASAEYSFASARSDASSDSANGFEGYIYPASFDLNWV